MPVFKQTNIKYFFKDEMDETDSELSGTDNSSDDDSIGEDDQGAVHWDEPDEELDRDLLNQGGVNGRSPNKAYQFVLWMLPYASSK